ncbi:hypothetical protein TSAR_002399 [Trichomalopsis sarcophagae]|uniref:Uncharacterized protein n=1 Tax=Trichomalopsis sarcophagae TaxID=543379 RepID=A0A232EGX2_9HYME|nr:hypothetical protein TSAR_002399 [Trichomalopsis sarcophagae]
MAQTKSMAPRPYLDSKKMQIYGWIQKNVLDKRRRGQRGPTFGTNNFDLEIVFEGHLKVKIIFLNRKTYF